MKRVELDGVVGDGQPRARAGGGTEGGGVPAQGEAAAWNWGCYKCSIPRLVRCRRATSWR